MLQRQLELIRVRRHSEEGATLILVAAAMAVLMPLLLAFTVNLGQQIDLNRAIDASTAAAGGATGSAILTAAQSAATADGLTPSNSPSAMWPNVYLTTTNVPGYWSPACGWHLTAGCPGAIATTGIQVAAQSSQGSLVKVIGNATTLKRTAIGAVAPSAGFEIGTTLASISSTDSSVLGALLTPAGISVSGGVVGYNGLVSSDVTLLSVIKASAGVLTPTNILTASFPPAGWAKLLGLADPSAGISTLGSTTACTGVNVPFTVGYVSSQPTCMTLCDIANISPWCAAGSVMPASGLGLTVNLLQALTTTADLANGTSALSLSTQLGLAPLVTASLAFTAISPPTVAFGPVGTQASNGQVSATLTIGTLLGNISIAVTGATGTATLTGVNCTNGAPNTSTTVQLNGVTTAATTTITTNIPLVSIGGVTLTGAPTTPLTFNGGTSATPYIPPSSASQTATGNNQNPQNIGTAAPTITAPGESLLGLIVNGLTGLVTFLTTNLVQPLFETLGVSLANASISALSPGPTNPVGCSTVALVQ
jgi:uncharacterized membrane protein